MISSLILAASAGTFAWYLQTAFARSNLPATQSWNFDAERRAHLHQHSQSYRWFAMLAPEVGSHPIVKWIGRSNLVELSLRQGASSLPLRSDEYLGLKAVEGVILGGALGVIWYLLAEGILSAVFVACLSPPIYVYMSAMSLAAAARQRMSQLCSRLPFAVDSIALMLGAGANTAEALACVVANCRGHAVAEEFGMVLACMRRGTSFRESMVELQQRLQVREIRNVASAALIAHDLGVPLGQVLLDLAEQMRVRRAQDIETAAGRAQVRMLYPATLMMIASMIAVIVPFLLPLLSSLSSWS